MLGSGRTIRGTIRNMPEDPEKSGNEPNLELPSLFGRGRKKKRQAQQPAPEPTQEIDAAATGTEVSTPVEEPAALAGLMDRFLSDPERLAKAREKVWLLGQRRYNWDKEAVGVVELVRQATEHQAGKPSGQHENPDGNEHSV